MQLKNNTKCCSRDIEEFLSVVAFQLDDELRYKIKTIGESSIKGLFEGDYSVLKKRFLRDKIITLESGTSLSNFINSFKDACRYSPTKNEIEILDLDGILIFYFSVWDKEVYLDSDSSFIVGEKKDNLSVAQINIHDNLLSLYEDYIKIRKSAYSLYYSQQAEARRIAHSIFEDTIEEAINQSEIFLSPNLDEHKSCTLIDRKVTKNNLYRYVMKERIIPYEKWVEIAKRKCELSHEVPPLGRNLFEVWVQDMKWMIGTCLTDLSIKYLGVPIEQRNGQSEEAIYHIGGSTCYVFTDILIETQKKLKAYDNLGVIRKTLIEENPSDASIPLREINKLLARLIDALVELLNIELKEYPQNIRDVMSIITKKGLSRYPYALQKKITVSILQNEDISNSYLMEFMKTVPRTETSANDKTTTYTCSLVDLAFAIDSELDAIKSTTDLILEQNGEKSGIDGKIGLQLNGKDKESLIMKYRLRS